MSSPPTPVVLDCDTGTDDAVAIACALGHPGVDLLGVSTVRGNHDVDHTTDNTRRVLEALGAAHVPVVRGASGPFRPRHVPLPAGRADLPPTLDLPPATRGPVDVGVVDWLAATLDAAPGRAALVATGPASNVAALAEEHPATAARTDLVLLAGTHREPGVGPRVERNAWCDPAGLAAVLAARWRRVRLVGMDATFSVPLDGDDVDALHALGTPAAAMAARFHAERIAWYRQDPPMAALGAAPLHDPLALAAVTDPHLLTWHAATVEVDLRDTADYGRTVLGLDADAGPTAIEVALAADRAGYRRWLTRALGRP